MGKLAPPSPVARKVVRPSEVRRGAAVLARWQDLDRQDLDRQERSSKRWPVSRTPDFRVLRGAGSAGMKRVRLSFVPRGSGCESAYAAAPLRAKAVT